MTVHNFQGSEFDRVLLPDLDLPVLTREIICTAVMKARETVVRGVFEQAKRHERVPIIRHLFESSMERPTVLEKREMS